MNLNIQTILTGSMKVLNIVNKTLPLVKEFNPSIKAVMNKVKNLNINTNNINKTRTKIIDSSFHEKSKNNISNLTFFK